MLLSGSVPEITGHYDPAEYERWKTGDHSGFPVDDRLAHSVYRQPNRYFGETHWVRTLMGSGWRCWSDRYVLFSPRSPKSRSGKYAHEIDGLIGPGTLATVQSLSRRVSFSPKDPDVVAFNSSRNKWGFFEVKMPRDRPHENQLRSLLLLQLVTGARVAIVRLEPFGVPTVPRDYPCTFEILLPDLKDGNDR